MHENTSSDYPRAVSSGSGPARPPDRPKRVKTRLGFFPDAGARVAHYLRRTTPDAEPERIRRPVVGWVDRGYEWEDLSDYEDPRTYVTERELVPGVLDDRHQVVAAGDLVDCPGVALVGVFTAGDEPGPELLAEVADKLRADLIGELPPLCADEWGTARRRQRYAATVRKASKSSLHGLIEKVLNAPKDEQDRLLGWATKRLVAQEWAGYLTRDQVRGYVEDLLDATSWAGRNSKPTPYTVHLEIAVAEHRADQDALTYAADQVAA